MQGENKNIETVATQLVSEHTTLNCLPQSQRKYIQKLIESDITGVKKPQYKAYLEANPEAKVGTAQTESTTILKKPRIKFAIAELRNTIINEYGYLQFCTELTRVAHNSKYDSNRIKACNSMLKVMGLHQQEKKQVNLNINLTAKDMKDFEGLFND